MALLSSDHVGTLTETNAMIAQQQKDSVFCVVRAVGATSQLQECSVESQFVKRRLSWNNNSQLKGTTVERQLRHGSRGIATVRSRYTENLVKTL
jgi:hypothetical protein